MSSPPVYCQGNSCEFNKEGGSKLSGKFLFAWLSAGSRIHIRLSGEYALSWYSLQIPFMTKQHSDSDFPLIWASGSRKQSGIIGSQEQN